ncbi:MAG: hypothetical protein LBP69_02555 [Treponema sp.]|nr:hypothetical protein [Treponema sp.]
MVRDPEKPEADHAPGTSAETIEAAAAESAELKSAEPEPESESAPAIAIARPAKKFRPAVKYRDAYTVPVEGILNQYPDGQYWIVDETTQQAARILQETLKEFSIEAEVTGIRKGPVITMFEILPAPGVKLSKIVNLQDNIALRLAASSVRIVAPIPGKHAVGIEVPNKKRNIVSFREIIEGELRREGKRPEIPVVLGKDITGEAVTVDLAQMPHLLIAGSTGSGKSVCVNSMILSILYQRAPAECRLILIDPKIVELKLYNDIPHLLTPVITEPKKAFQALQYCIYEMERRYACLDSMGVRDVKSYNRRIRERSIAAEYMPYIVVVIDEFADLMATTGKELESTVARLAAMSRAVGIEVPNKKRNIVSFREIIEGELRREGKKPEIPVVLGKDITGEAVTVDLAQMPHILIAGSTGSGKSVCVNSMILSLLYQRPPAECRLILIDPKIVELKLYNDIPHLLTPVITEPKKAFQALQYCICEMERRYACLDSMGVRDIKSYNRRIRERDIAAEYMPYIVIVIDEFADLMATTGKELESTVARLAAMSRAVGIHLVLATQRPSIDVITGLIKANIPSRIAFMVASKMDSRIIIDMVGAEKLLGKGDMLYAGAVDPFPIRMQGAFVSEEEVERVVDYVKSLGAPEYIDDEIFYDEEEDSGPSLFADGDDPLYDKALEIVYQQGKASASYIQRRLKIGYNRAARLVEEMEHHGVVGPAQGSKPRELLHIA